MSTTAVDLALWVGNAGATRHDGTELIPGVTICEVSRGEAEASDHWQPVDETGKPLKPKRSRTAPSESAGTGEAAGAPSEQDGES